MEYSKLEQFYKDDAYCGFGSEIKVERYKEYAEYVKSHVSNKVFEIGSGLGLAALAIKLAGVEVSATDIFPQNAEKTFLKNNISIEVIELNVNKITLADNVVDNFCLYQVMEHIESPEIAIAEIYRTLKPGGSFILVGPNLISPLTSLKSFVMAITRKWDTPFFSRNDGYEFPFGSTVVECFFIIFINLYRTFLKLLLKSKRNIIFRKPCLIKPAISDSDAVILLNPIDMREMLLKTGFSILDYQTKRLFGSFAGSTWIVARK